MLLPLELMQKLRDTLAPPPLPEKPAERLLDLEIKLDKVQKEAERLHSVVSKKQEDLRKSGLRTKKKEGQQVLAVIDEVNVTWTCPLPLSLLPAPSRCSS